MMKRVMFVCQSLGNGGAERVVSVLTDGLSKENMEVFVLAMNNVSQSYKMNKNVKVIFANRKRTGVLGKIERILKIREAIKTNQIDIVIAFSHYNAMYSVLASIGVKVALIGSERNDPACLQKKKITNFLRNILYRKLDVLVCQTFDAKEYFSDKIQKKTVVIMNPISDDLPQPYYGEREKRFVSYLRLEPQKNIPLMIRAFERILAEFPDYRLDIYGDGSEKYNLLNYIKTRNIDNSVHVYPFEKNIHEVVKNAKAFLLTSNFEGMSNSMIESMAIGLPVIVTDCPCGGAKMVIEDGNNGILIPVGNEDVLVQSIRKIIVNNEFATRLSENGVKIRDRLEKSKIIEEWKEIIATKGDK